MSTHSFLYLGSAFESYTLTAIHRQLAHLTRSLAALAPHLKSHQNYSTDTLLHPAVEAQLSIRPVGADQGIDIDGTVELACTQQRTSAGVTTDARTRLCRLVVQCKRSGKRVPPAVVRELLGARSLLLTERHAMQQPCEPVVAVVVASAGFSPAALAVCAAESRVPLVLAYLPFVDEQQSAGNNHAVRRMHLSPGLTSLWPTLSVAAHRRSPSQHTAAVLTATDLPRGLRRLVRS